MQVVKDIDLKELVDYAADRNVGIILWAGYYAFERDMAVSYTHLRCDMGGRFYIRYLQDRKEEGV